MIPMMIVLIGLYQALIHLSCDPSNAANIAMTYCIPERSHPVLRLLALDREPRGADIPTTIGGIPIPGILPIAMLITQFAYGKMTPTTGSADDPQQQMMMRMTTYFMPIMLFFSFNFGRLVLYWTISNIFEIARMGFTVGWEPEGRRTSSAAWSAPPWRPPAEDTAPKRATARREEDLRRAGQSAARPPAGGSRKGSVVESVEAAGPPTRRSRTPSTSLGWSGTRSRSRCSPRPTRGGRPRPRDPARRDRARIRRRRRR